MLGHAHKLIAYELGLATGTVSSVIARLRNKLGARTRAELLSRLGALWRRGHLSTVEGSEQGGPESS